MKIIIYGLNFKPEIVGVGKYTGELADYLSSKKHKIRVITTSKYYPQFQTKNNKYQIEKNHLYRIYRCPIYVPKTPNGIKRVLHWI